MKRTVARILIALLLAGTLSLPAPASAQSQGGGHHGAGGHQGTSALRGTAGHHGTGGHHRVLHSSARDIQVRAGVHPHGHRSLAHGHMHSPFWSRRLASRCDRLGWGAHDHHWRSAFDYYGLFDREPGVECVQNDEAAHW